MSEHHPIVIVGAGPVGLSAALELAALDRPSVVLEMRSAESDGSRAICWSQRTLEIWKRVGVAQPVIDRGVTWQVGKVFYEEDLAYEFDLQPEPGFAMPAFVNLQQNIVEGLLLEAVAAAGVIDLRWATTVTKSSSTDEQATLTVDGPDGSYVISCDWLIAADGARSTVRRDAGLSLIGRTFEDKFLISDIRMTGTMPTERWFWFDPPFHQGRSTLLHRQSDDVWRVDFQLGRDVDPEEETDPERIKKRIQAMFGDDIEFEIEWVSIYRFQSRHLENFRHKRALFVGDSAHQVSPFGARGANAGIQDAENLVWKLDLVMSDTAPESLLDTYSDERVYAAAENLAVTTQTIDFMTPQSDTDLALRTATLGLARRHGFARPLVNSGRLSVATVHHGSPLSTADSAVFEGDVELGGPVLDAPVHGADGDWLLDYVGREFVLLFYGNTSDVPAGLPPDLRVVTIGEGGDIVDISGLVAKRLGWSEGCGVLVRPDQHLAARWKSVTVAGVVAGLARARGMAEAA
ncbi:2-polyprenyl-6-methoxyphenol hydroxylase and related FAD-dependent oxidoreductases [hydrothermal vent metagenome]|uniref:2-polyprenyl-6-methoxyphenol hydroxylase and related FAD-dependent oxidoreductases n=1 Tax=hydrothermal vent metagenome TaxID=652676 RepID=A0A3B0TJK8_9ZZZZ